MDVVGSVGRMRTARVAVVLGLALATGAAGLSVAPSSDAVAADAVLPGEAVPLLPGLDGYDRVERGTDALYIQVERPLHDPAIYRRALTTTADGIALGAPEYVGRGALDGRIAVHGDTLAYARAIDGRLVLRAPDGTETVPAWDATTHGFVRGIGDLTADWVVGDTLGSWPHLFDLQTGAELDVRALDPDPGVPSVGGVASIEVSDTRLLWTVQSVPMSGSSVFGVYTVALGPDGPTGPVTTLEQNVCPSGSCMGDVVWDVDVVGDAVIWIESTTADVATIRGFAAPPYDGEPSELLVASTTLAGVAGTDVVLSHPRSDGQDLAWHELFSADPAVPVRTLFVPGYGVPLDETLATYTPNGSSGTLLVDASGGTITADPAPVPPMPSFSDVPRSEFTNAAFYGEIMWLADHGVVGGYPDGTFRGLAPVNRDAMAAFLYRVAHDGAAPPACTTAPFTDVPVTHPFCAQIAWLASVGVATGWPDGTFRPAQPVSRGAMAAFLSRFAHDGASAPACTAAPFTDVAVGSPFCGDIAWLASTGITRGWPDGTFRPAQPVSRGAMAALLFRFVDGGHVPTS